jgi:hypothetical protein
MKIIELKEIYMMCYLMACGENCIVYHNGTANVFSNMERIYHSKLYKLEVRRTAHKKLYLQRRLDMEDKPLASSDMKRVQDSQEPRFSMISVGDLKIDALYI